MGEAGIIERIVPANRTKRTLIVQGSGASGQKTFVEADMTTWSEGDYTRLLAEFEQLFNTPHGSASSARYEALADLIEAYEEANYPMREPVVNLAIDA